MVGSSGAAALRITAGTDRLKLDPRRPKWVGWRGARRGEESLEDVVHGDWGNLTEAIDDGLDRHSP